MLRGLEVAFEDELFLHDIDLEVKEGEIVALLGPSGCGKTTLLRSIAGLQELYNGTILLEGETVSVLPPEARGVGMVFQSPTLFPHLDVAGNLALALPQSPMRERLQRTLRREPDLEASRKIAEVLEQVGLAGFEDRNVENLSGGEAQRVAVARALLLKPRLLLLDEPLSALDRALRNELRRELRIILKEVGVAAVYVTHDQGEAVAVADRIALMRQGRIIQVDRPTQLYQSPVNAWAARFLGLENLLECEILSHDEEYIKLKTGLVELDPLKMAAPVFEFPSGSCHLILGPGALTPATNEGWGPAIATTILEREVKPIGLRLRVRAKRSLDEGVPVEFSVDLPDQSWEQRPGDNLNLVVDLSKLVLVPSK